MKSKKAFILTITMLFIATFALSQELIQYPAGSLYLKIKGEGGKNGAAVVYNPVENLYYCVMAGNSVYPLETFDRNGKNIYQAEAYNDMRGMWWNPKEKALEGNCYLDGGIVSIGLTERGHAGTGNRVIFEGSEFQPFENACGTYNPKSKEILYYQDGIVLGYSRKDGRATDTYIKLALPVEEEEINWVSLIFTGKKGMELGVLDVYAKKVYLFSFKDGSHSATVNLPKSAMVYEAFNFSYANDYIFLFDQDERKWTGYRIF